MSWTRISQWLCIRLWLLYWGFTHICGGNLKNQKCWMRLLSILFPFHPPGRRRRTTECRFEWFDFSNCYIIIWSIYVSVENRWISRVLNAALAMLLHSNNKYKSVSRPFRLCSFFLLLLHSLLLLSIFRPLPLFLSISLFSCFSFPFHIIDR